MFDRKPTSWSSNPMYYDIIGDIHGHAEALEALLSRLGYVETGGVYAHPEQHAVFVGDFIDRGPAIRETLAIVRRMVDSGSARTVMGNHEYNAICFNRQRPDDSHRWLRSRTDRHVHQHLETIYQFRNYRAEWNDYLNWFFGHPLFLDLGSIRVVHAAWYEPSLSILRRHTGEKNRLTDAFLYRATRRGNVEFDAIQNVLKGVEVDIPMAKTFIDKDGNERKEMRVRWWLDAAGKPSRDMAVPSRPEVHDTLIPDAGASRMRGYGDAVPVFFGHYWFDNPSPSILAANAACLDFSVARGGYLAAYRWRGEKTLTDEHFVTYQ